MGGRDARPVAIDLPAVGGATVEPWVVDGCGDDASISGAGENQPEEEGKAAHGVKKRSESQQLLVAQNPEEVILALCCVQVVSDGIAFFSGVRIALRV